METPNEPINYVPADGGEILNFGPVKMRIIEDGTRTSNRLGMVEHQRANGALARDARRGTGFLVTKGTVRFHVPDLDDPSKDAKTIDAKAGDFVMVPTHAPHTFSNPSDAESRFVCTLTPAYYANYFRLMAKMVAATGGKLTPKMNSAAMQRFATIPVASTMPGEVEVPSKS